MVDRPIFQFSAGGVVIRDGECLVIRARNLKGRSVWTFPKGQLQEGEDSRQAAVREVREETGWQCQIERELPRSEYWFQRNGQRIKKTVHWFRMLPIEQVGKPDFEVEEARWMPIEEARTRLTYRSDRQLLEAAIASAEQRLPKSEKEEFDH